MQVKFVRRFALVSLCAGLSVLFSRRTLATETDGQPEPLSVANGGCSSTAQPTNCKDICNGQGDGSCCFAKCVCDTDPNKEVRNKYCQEYLDLGCNKIARR